MISKTLGVLLILATIAAEISFDHLTAEWRRVITERRAAA
jgi:hypothetical protein